ncbi:MAG: galactokinase [Abditibacteriota bacterium]|nr:galactokinase [Abditibacteriota bacterium]
MNLESLFSQHFGAPDESTFTVRAPGRVNLIGEHVDYNDGFVLPMAISLQTVFMLRPRADRMVRLYAANFEETREFSLDNIQKQNTWLDYVQGVARELAGASVPLHGFEGVIISDVPTASGLSSSAALEVGAAIAFTHLEQQPMAPSDLAVICQRAENKFVGVNSGIMDQMAVAACRRDHVLLLDCRSLDMEHVPFRLADHVVVVTDSAAPRELAGSAYNERRAQCEEGLKVLQRALPHISSLRDVTPADLQAHGSTLSPIVLQRVRHVVSEIARTLEAVAALKAGDMATFGQKMNDSHESLRHDYEVTSHELDWLADYSRTQPGVLGSRMTGAGFGGCTVTLMERAHAEAFVQNLPIKYLEATGRQARCWICEAEDGAHIAS